MLPILLHFTHPNHQLPFLCLLLSTVSDYSIRAMKKLIPKLFSWFAPILNFSKQIYK